MTLDEAARKDLPYVVFCVYGESEWNYAGEAITYNEAKNIADLYSSRTVILKRTKE